MTLEEIREYAEQEHERTTTDWRKAHYNMLQATLSPGSGPTEAQRTRCAALGVKLQTLDLVLCWLGVAQH